MVVIHACAGGVLAFMCLGARCRMKASACINAITSQPISPFTHISSHTSYSPWSCVAFPVPHGVPTQRAPMPRQVPSNYETGLIFPIVQCAAELAGVDYHSANDDTKRMLNVNPSLLAQVCPTTMALLPLASVRPPPYPAQLFLFLGRRHYAGSVLDASHLISSRCGCTDLHTLLHTSAVPVQVIGDHATAVVHLVADGVSPSNLSRGYVMIAMSKDINSNVIDRAEGVVEDLRCKERQWGNGVIAMSADINNNVGERVERVVEELQREDERFVGTLERGEKMLHLLLSQALSAAIDSAADDAAADGAAADGAVAGREGGEGGGRPTGAVLSGRDAFVLYDMYGFPVEITEEVARERGVAVDMAGFKQQMTAQSRQSGAQCHQAGLGGAAADLAGQVPETEFVGYSSLASSSPVVALVVDCKVVEHAAAGQAVDVVLARTPFYAEGGGQIGDWGHMRVLQGTQGEGEGEGGRAVVRVRDVQRAGGGLWLHRGRAQVRGEGMRAQVRGEGMRAQVRGEGMRVQVRVSAEVRAEVKLWFHFKFSPHASSSSLRSAPPRVPFPPLLQAHHTATHLLQAALREQLGPDVAQAGSLVAFDRLRFDFHFPRALTPKELATVESRVNRRIVAGADITAAVMPIADAKAAWAIAMFGENYGDEVCVGGRGRAGRGFRMCEGAGGAWAGPSPVGTKYGAGAIAMFGEKYVHGSEHVSRLQHTYPPRPLLPPLSSPSPSSTTLALSFLQYPRPLLPPLSSPLQVRVIDVPGISMELCGGTHVGNTAHIRAFKLLSEAGMAAGVRRIEAVAGEAAVELLHQWDGVVKAFSSSLKVRPCPPFRSSLHTHSSAALGMQVKAEEVLARVALLQEELRAASFCMHSLEIHHLCIHHFPSVSLVLLSVLVAELPGVTSDALKSAAESLAAQLSASSDGGSSEEGKVAIVALLSPAVSGSCLLCAHAHLMLFLRHFPQSHPFIPCKLAVSGLTPTHSRHPLSCLLPPNCLLPLAPPTCPPFPPRRVPQVVKAGVNVGKLAGTMARVCGGGGGGRPNVT
ncbi:unnamed protein product [Closterium sp. Yama58-4]|nr:unnamed protein product [Closterium sp. Yama58-4]